MNDCFLDCIADLYIFALAEPDVTIPVTNDNDSPELDTATGVSHPLHHLDIQHLVFEVGQERIDDLRLLDRPPALEDLVDTGDFTCSDLSSETGERYPFDFFVCHFIPAPS